MVLDTAPPRHLTKLTPEQIRRIADRLEPAMQATFLDAFESLSRQLPLNQLTELIEQGNVAAVQDLVAGLQLPPDALAATRQALTDAAQRAAENTALEFGFQIRNENVVPWIDQHTGQLISSVTQETRLAVADIIRQGYIEGVPVRTQARQIRRVVGLTARDAGAVDRFLRAQLEAGISRDRAEKMAQRMTDRLLRRRAENIARTETMTATNQGQLEAWKQAADQGLINRQTTRRVWIATGDDRLCPICAILDGQTVAFTESFIATEQATGFDIKPAGVLEGTPQVDIKPTGTKPLKNPVTTMTPPAHPSCRCTVGLEIGGQEFAPDLSPLTESPIVSAAPKRHKKLIQSSLDKADDRLADAPEHIRAKYRNAMTRFENHTVTTERRRKRGLRQGATKTSPFGIKPNRYPELQLETHTFNEDWVRWQAKRTAERNRLAPGLQTEWDRLNPEPAFYRFVNSDELSGTVLHELTHAMDYFDEFDAGRRGVTRRAQRWIDDGLHELFNELKNDFAEFEYGASAPGEGMAEAVRMYLTGLRGTPSRRGRVGVMSADEWRKTFPQIVKAVEDIVWGAV